MGDDRPRSTSIHNELNTVEDEIDSLNPLLIAATSNNKAKQDQNKNYCQVCFKQFSLLMSKYHCYFCTRSCCSSCSKMTKDGQSELVRTCEYCIVKIENTQIEQFY